jgi:hypothetical protein
MNNILGLLVFIISIGLIYLILKKVNSKSKEKKGCLSGLLISLPVLLLVSFTPFLLMFGIAIAKEYYQLTFDKDFKPYTAQVVRYEDIYENRERLNKKTKTTLMGTPMVTFTIETGEVLEKKLSFATSINGKSSYSICYKAKTDEIIILDVYIVVKTIGFIVFFTIFIFAYWGIFFFLTDRPMKNYGNYLFKGILYGVILTMTIGLCAGLIYGVLTKELSLWAQVICVFFSLALIIVILMIFLSMFRSKVEPLQSRRKTAYRKDN